MLYVLPAQANQVHDAALLWGPSCSLSVHANVQPFKLQAWQTVRHWAGMRRLTLRLSVSANDLHVSASRHAKVHCEKPEA